MGVFSVLAVLVAVAVAGVSISAHLQRRPSLEVVIDMPPPAAVQVVEQATEPAPEQVAAAAGSDAEAASIENLSAEAEAGVAREAADPLVEDVPEIDTAAGSDDFDATPQPNPIPEKADVRTEGPEQTAAPAIEVPDKVPDGGGASNEAVGDAAETAAETSADAPSRDDLNSLAVTVVEPATEENRPPVTSTYDGPTPLFGAVVISRRSNLRSEPGPDSPVIAKLNPGERVFRLDDKPVFGYYRVSSGGVVGWVWWLNVRDGPGGNIQG